MSCRNAQSSNCLVRWPLGLGLLAASAGSTAQLATDLVMHNGFEACWSTAITKSQFLGLMKSTADATTACVPELPGYPLAGFFYDICNTAACPNNQIGCPVALNAGTFSGDFGTGAFSAPGSTDAVSIAVSYADGPITSGTCTITLTNITQTYHSSFIFQPDGNNGEYTYYAGFTDAPAVTFGTVVPLTPDMMCATLFSAFGGSLIQSVEVAASIELTTAFDSTFVGQSVCPLTP